MELPFLVLVHENMRRNSLGTSIERSQLQLF
jgi:hypothetical protein